MSVRARAVLLCGLVALCACGDDDDRGSGGGAQVTITTAAATSTTTGQPTVVLVSDSCATAMQAADDAITESEAIYDPLAIATVSECKTVAEFAQALHDRPGAMGLTEAAVNNEATMSFEEHLNISLFSLCSAAPAEAPVCVDAVALGRLVPCRDDPTRLCMPHDDG